MKGPVSEIKVIEINPNISEAHNNLGLIYMQMKKIEEAKTCFEKAIQVNPNHADPCNNLALVFMNSGEMANAEKFYKKAIEINSKNFQAINNLGVLYKIQLIFVLNHLSYTLLLNHNKLLTSCL